MKSTFGTGTKNLLSWRLLPNMKKRESGTKINYTRFVKRFLLEFSVQICHIWFNWPQAVHWHCQQTAVHDSGAWSFYCIRRQWWGRCDFKVVFNQRAPLLQLNIKPINFSEMLTWLRCETCTGLVNQQLLRAGALPPAQLRLWTYQ